MSPRMLPRALLAGVALLALAFPATPVAQDPAASTVTITLVRWPFT